MTEPAVSSTALRTAREALVAQLIGDVDRLLDRVERIAPAIENAAVRLERASQALDVATRANSEWAKASVGDYIARRTNETVKAARAELLDALTEARHAATAADGSVCQRSPAPQRQDPDAGSSYGRWSAWVATLCAAVLVALVVTAGAIPHRW